MRSGTPACAANPTTSSTASWCDGQVKWVREKAYLEFDDAGGLLGGFGITQDITDAKERRGGAGRRQGRRRGRQRRPRASSWPI